MLADNFEFRFEDMLQWYHNNIDNKKYFEGASNRCVHTHIHKSHKYETVRASSPIKGEKPKKQLCLFLKKHITLVGRLLPSIYLPFLPTKIFPSKKYPNGMFVLPHLDSRALYFVFPLSKSNINGQSKIFADHFTFVFDKNPKHGMLNLHQTVYKPDEDDILIGTSEKEVWNPIPNGVILPLKSYSTNVFSKFEQYANDVLDLCRLPKRIPNQQQMQQNGGGRAVPSRARSKDKPLPAKKKTKPTLRTRRHTASACAPRKTQVSARLTRVLLRHNIQDVRLFGFQMPDPVTRVPAWHYTCFLERSAPDPVLGEHDLAFQTSDATWRSAQHALIRRIKELERAHAAKNQI
jgi:hypothetical protein